MVGRAPGQVANNLHVNIFDNEAVVNVEGGDRFDPPDYGPIRFEDLNQGRDLIPLHPQRIPVPEDDDDDFVEQADQQDSDEPRVLEMDQDA
eukprot:666560-Amphidinium_carterae.2